MFQDYFLWKPEYSVNIREIDCQHKKIIEMLNTLYFAFMSKEPMQKVGSILKQLEDYSYLHFGTEEKYFNQFMYEHALEHIREHENFKEKVEKFKLEFENNNAVLSFSIINFLREWLNTHILIEDKKYSQFLISKGLK